MTRHGKWKRVLLLSAAVIGAACAATPVGAQQVPAPLDASARATAINAAIATFEQHYVFPDKAATIAAHLRTALQRGDYDAITSGDKLAETLSAALQKEAGDHHLEVRYFAEALPEPSKGAGQAAAERAEEMAAQRRNNYGFTAVSRLPLNIGYVDLRAFGRPAGAAARIAAAMTLMADTRALIIDLRKCGGGDPETVMLFASYLFDKPTHLNDIYWRDENRTERRWTRANVSGAKYGGGRKLYVLTGANSFSAAEDFAYAMQASGRARLVGAVTKGGGAQPGEPRRIDPHFMMFVPNGRAINPVTHSNWQETGVVPDLKVTEAKALDAAQIEILKDVMASDPDPHARQGAKDRLADLG